MKLQLLYFGIVRERLGCREETREIASGATVGQLLAELAGSHGIFALGAGSIRIAVNREYVENDHVLADGDEVAVIPPVAGGSSLPVAGGSALPVAGGSAPPVAGGASPPDAGLPLPPAGGDPASRGRAPRTCWPFRAARGH